MFVLTSRGAVEIGDSYADYANPEFLLRAVITEASKPQGCANPGTELRRTGVDGVPFLKGDYILFRGIWQFTPHGIEYDNDRPYRGEQRDDCFFDDLTEFRDGFFDDCE